LLQAQLQLGEVVLDLGCGSGREALQAVELVGPTGLVFGLDSAAEALISDASCHPNIRWLRADARAIPLPTTSVDVVFSNCVLNQIGDKSRALAEVWRILKPQGRFVFSDIVSCSPANLPRQEMLDTAAALLGCTTSVLSQPDYLELMAKAGFQELASAVFTTIPYRLLKERAMHAGSGALAALAVWAANDLQDALASVTFSGRKL